MPVLRFLTSVFALIAVLSLVADATPAFYGVEPFSLTTVMEYWQELAPASLEAAHNAVIHSAPAWVWDPVITAVLGRPTAVLFGGLAVFFGFMGRRREELKVHVN